MPDKKRGRLETDNPKSVRVDVRLTEQELKILDKHCSKNGVSRPQGLRDGIKFLITNNGKWCACWQTYYTTSPPAYAQKQIRCKYYSLCRMNISRHE